MSSRMLLGSKKAVLIIGRSGKIRWGRKPDHRNACIGAALRGKAHPGTGKASPVNSKGQAFTSAVRSCPAGGVRRGKRKAKSAEEW